MEPSFLKLKITRNNAVVIDDDWVVAELNQLAATGRELCRRASVGDTSVFGAVEDLARRILPLDRVPAAGSGCVYLQPSSSDWSAIELIPWEVLFEPSRACPVRATSARSAPAIDAGELRVLIVFCAPSGPSYTALPEESPDRVVRLVKQHLPNEVVVVRGPDSLGQLAKLARSREPFHIVHVIAHASRETGQVCLEDSKGREQHVPFATFADALGGVRPGLVTLQMCNSSALALELNQRLESVRVVGALHDVRQTTLAQFFALFYERLLAPQEARAYVETAFRRAIEQLGFVERQAEWFQLVVYAPSDRAPFLDLTVEHEMQAILRQADAGELVEARDRVRALAGSPHPRVCARAKELQDALEPRATYSENLKMFEKDIVGVARKQPPGGDQERQGPPWQNLRRRWPEERFASPAMNGPMLVPDRNALLNASKRLTESANVCLQAIDGKLRTCSRLALDGVGAMAEFEGGKHAALLAGCNQLLELTGQSGNRDLRDAVEIMFEDALEDVLARATAPLKPGSRLPSVHEALEILQQVRRLAAEGRRLGVLTERAYMNITSEVGDLIAKAHTVVQGAQRAIMVPLPLLAPGQRFELVAWLREHERGAGRPPEAPDDLESLLGHVREQMQLSAGLDLSSPARRRELVPVIANEGPPFLLTCELSRALQPYLSLARFGLTYDTPSTVLHEIETAICRIADIKRRQELLAQHAMLSDYRRRLICDATVIACRDADECSRVFRAITVAAFSTGPAIELPASLDPLDRAALHCMIGQSNQALAIALDQVRAAANDLETVRAAYLIALHCAEVARGDAPAVARAARVAIGLVGMLAADDDALTMWVTRRLAVYRAYVPPDLPDLVKTVARGMIGLFDDFVARYVALGDEATALGRMLQAELSAELRAAENPLTRKLVEHRALIRVGGYHGAGLIGSLGAIGEYLVRLYQTLSRLRGNDYTDVVSATGMSVEGFGSLVCAFSELRLAEIQPPAEALRAIGPLLPTTEDLLDGVATAPPASIAAQLDAASAEQLPFHVRLPTGQRERVFAAHVAMVAAEKYREQVEQELARDEWMRPLVVSLFDQLKATGDYVLNLGYKLGGVTFEPASQIDGVLRRWLERVSARLEKLLEQPAGRDRDLQQRRLVESTCKLADSVASRYADRVGVEVNQARAQLHHGLGVLLHNKFGESLTGLGHVKTAFTIASTPEYVAELLTAVAVVLLDRMSPAQRRRVVDDSVVLLESRRGSLDRAVVDDAVRKLRRLLEPTPLDTPLAKPEPR